MTETFKLKFKRSGFVGCAVIIFYEIDHDPAQTGKISLTATPELELSRQAHHVRFYLKGLPLSKQTEKEILVDPGHGTNEMLVNLKLKMNFIGMLPVVSLFYPTCSIVTEVSYDQ